MPVMITIALAVVSLVRREPGRFFAIGTIGLAVVLLFWGSSDPTTSSANLDAAEIESWNWYKDPSFGRDGTVKWNVVVRNKSDRPIENVRVEFTSYDASGGLLDSTFTYVDAIPAGDTRSVDSFADYYGTESRAEVKVAIVRFSTSP